MFQQFREHPAAVGEGYLQHFARAAGFGLCMIGAGLACIVHAVFPFWFQHTGSDSIRKLHQVLELRRSQAVSAQPDHRDGSLF